MGILKVRTGTSPDVWVEVGSSGVETDTAALALKVAKAGDTMTGALIMQNVTPEVRLIETDQAVDSKVWRMYSSGGLLSIGSALDNLAAVKEVLIARDASVTATEFLGIGRFLTQLNASNISQGTLNSARLPATIDANTTGTAARLQTARLVSLSGDVTGSATFNGSADIDIATTLMLDAIVLGADTTGNYVRSVTGTTNRITVTPALASESVDITLNLPQDIHIGATPQFVRVTFSQTTGTAPFVVQSSTKVTSLNADFLDDQEGAFYLNLANATGVLPQARMGTQYPSISQIGTLTELYTTDTATVKFGDTPYVYDGADKDTLDPTKLHKMWHEGNDGIGSLLDADKLDGLDSSAFAPTEVVEALLGDLLFVGLWDAAKYTQTAVDFNYTAIAGQNTKIPYTLRANSNADVRITCLRPLIAAGASQRVVSGGDASSSFRMIFTSTGITMEMRNSLGTWRTISFGYVDPADPVPDGTLKMPRPPHEVIHNAGASDEWRETVASPIQLRMTWDATGKILTGYWRDLSFDLRDDRGWNSSASSPFAGDTLPTGARNLVFSDEPTFYYIANTTPLIAGQIPRAIVKGDAWQLNPAIGTASMPDKSTTHVDADMTWVFRAEITNDTNAVERIFVSQRSTATDIAMRAGILLGNQLVLRVSANGTAATSAAPGADLKPFLTRDVGGAVVPEVRTLAVSLDLDNGEGQHVINYHIMDEDTNLFTMIHSVKTDGVLTALNNSTQPVRIGTQPGGTPYDGRIFSVQMHTGLEPILDPAKNTLRWRFDAADYSTGLTHTDARGDVWTQTTTGAIALGQDLLADFNVRKVPGTDVDTFNIAMPGSPPQTVTVPASVDLTTSMPIPQWSQGTHKYRNGLYWIASSTTTDVNFIDSDYSGRYEVTDEPVDVANGDWVICLDPNSDPSVPGGKLLDLNRVTFQFIPFSTETYVKAKIDDHKKDPEHPHQAAGYLRKIDTDDFYAQKDHDHDADIERMIEDHRNETNPHPLAGWLTVFDANLLYAPKVHVHTEYEPYGVMEAHEKHLDPHTQYLLEDVAIVSYAKFDHQHPEYAFTGHTHTFGPDKDIIPTDAAVSALLYVGATTPAAPKAGDLWLQSFDITNVPPLQAPTLITTAITSASISLAWTFPTGLITEVKLEYSLTGSGGWVVLVDDTSAPLDTSYAHTSLGELTNYWYRLTLINSAGSSPIKSLGPIATLNNPPGAPPVTLGTVTASTAVITWTEPASTASDPLATTGTYSIYLGTTVVATVNKAGPLTYTFTGLSERTSYSLGVTAKDATGLVSTKNTVTATTPNGAPPPPTGASSTATTHNSITLNWVPVSVADFKHYEVWYTGGSTFTTTGSSYVFSGLAASTSYSFHVRTVDLGLLTSTNLDHTRATTANPDVTAPTAPIITSYEPEVSYGRMVVRFNLGTGAVTQYQIARSIEGATWTYDAVVPSTGDGGARAVVIGTWGVGTTTRVAVRNADANNNWSAWDYSTPWNLKTTPTYITASSTNQWRAYSGGQWGGAGSSHPYMDYFDEVAKNNMGCWFFGTTIASTLPGRTVVGCRVYMHRVAAGLTDGSTPHFYTHNLTTTPSAVTKPVISNGPVTGTPILVNETKEMVMTTAFGQALVNGTSARGICVWSASPVGQSNYAKFATTTEDASSGRIRIDHLG